jgi:hypothetical protein
MNFLPSELSEQDKSPSEAVFIVNHRKNIK